MAALQLEPVAPALHPGAAKRRVCRPGRVAQQLYPAIPLMLLPWGDHDPTGIRTRQDPGEPTGSLRALAP